MIKNIFNCVMYSFNVLIGCLQSLNEKKYENFSSYVIDFAQYSDSVEKCVVPNLLPCLFVNFYFVFVLKSNEIF